MMEGDGQKAGSNWMREQWVANLRKKQMANAAAANTATLRANPVKSLGGLTSHDGHTLEKNINAHNRHHHRHTQHVNMPNGGLGLAYSEKDHLVRRLLVSLALLWTALNSQFLPQNSLSHSSMLFNDLGGCFEIESPSFTHVTPPRTYTTSTGNNRSKATTKKNIKPLLKKRTTHYLALDVNQPKPRTPRRKLNDGNAFDDCNDNQTFGNVIRGFSSVGTPSNFNADVAPMWGSDLDFAGDYVNTFLDLPTPKSAEMPTVLASSNAISLQELDNQKEGEEDDDLEQPKLIRTSSIEQEGLSHFLEQTNLGSESESNNEDDAERGRSISSNNNDLFYQTIASSPSHRIQLQHRLPVKKNQFNLASPSPRGTTYNLAAIEAVEDCFNRLLSPRARSTGSPAYRNQARGLARSTLGGEPGLAHHDAPNFDHRNMPEFETLLEEYKFTDIDQELDSFYLDNMDSFGGDLDLISN